MPAADLSLAVAGAAAALAVVAVAALIGLAFAVRRLAFDLRRDAARIERAIDDRLRDSAARVADQFAASQQQLGVGLSSSTEALASLHGRLGQVVEMATRVETLAGRVDALGRILSVPKLRGLMGERTLEALLEQVLPARFWATQHRFLDGRMVDAVVRLKDRLLPIDAKFPLESYRRLVEAEDEDGRSTARRELERAVAARVDEIAMRYVRPDEGTTDMALMYIPAEGVYAELLNGGAGSRLVDLALARRVVPVSPATLYAYVSVVAAGLQGVELERRTRDLVRGLVAIEHEVERSRDELSVLGRHLHNAIQRLPDVARRLDRVADQVRGVAAIEGSEQAPE